MLTLLAFLVVAQTDGGPHIDVVVLDISQEDEVYEDESRALAEEVVDAFLAQKVTARRVDENELPPKGCRGGPCLAKVAKGSTALVAVDVVEEGKGRWGVAITGLASHNGMPLGGARYHVGPKTKRPHQDLQKFVQKLLPMLKQKEPK